MTFWFPHKNLKVKPKSFRKFFNEFKAIKIGLESKVVSQLR